nr:hypothetical protein [Acidobacteriota bacterium]
TLVDLKTLWPAYAPAPAGKRGNAKLSEILNSPGIFDDKMIVVDASDRGEKRGNALPLLLDLARTNIFLHDASVASLDALLDPARGEKSPHPFYLADSAQRADLIEFLRSLDTTPNSRAQAQSKSASTPRAAIALWSMLPAAAFGMVWLGF